MTAAQRWRAHCASPAQSRPPDLARFRRTDSLCWHYGNHPVHGIIAVIASPGHDYRNHLVSGTFVEARRNGDLSV